jgi:hypothetical protein
VGALAENRHQSAQDCRLPFRWWSGAPPCSQLASDTRTAKPTPKNGMDPFCGGVRASLERAASYCCGWGRPEHFAHSLNARGSAPDWGQGEGPTISRLTGGGPKGCMGVLGQERAMAGMLGCRSCIPANDRRVSSVQPGEGRQVMLWSLSGVFFLRLPIKRLTEAVV